MKKFWSQLSTEWIKIFFSSDVSSYDERQLCTYRDSKTVNYDKTMESERQIGVSETNDRKNLYQICG